MLQIWKETLVIDDIVQLESTELGYWKRCEMVPHECGVEMMIELNGSLN